MAVAVALGGIYLWQLRGAPVRRLVNVAAWWVLRSIWFKCTVVVLLGEKPFGGLFAHGSFEALVEGRLGAGVLYAKYSCGLFYTLPAFKCFTFNALVFGLNI